MTHGKRAHEVIDLSDSDTERESHVTASKAPRRSGTHDDPISLLDSEDEVDQPQLPIILHDEEFGLPVQVPSQVEHRPALKKFPADEMRAPEQKLDDVDFAGYWNDDAVYYNPDEAFGALRAFEDEDEENGNFGVDLFNHYHAIRPNPRAYARRRSPFRVPSPPPLPEYMTEDQCLARVLELFPDIAHNYVGEVHRECDGSIRQILDKIIDEPMYPKERDRKGKEVQKRELSAEAEQRRFTQQDRDLARGKMRKAILEILKSEFPKIPVHYIDRIQSEKTHLYPTYMALTEGQYVPVLPYTNAGHRVIREVDFPAIIYKYGEATASLETELAASRKARTRFETKYFAEALRKKEEEQNVERAKAEGKVAECATCFDESPLNRMIFCNATSSHYTCYECAATYIASEVGQSRCRLTCPDSSGCSGSFTEIQLRLVPDKDLVEKLLKLQQEQDVRDAGVDDVIECPFCDYKQVCPPVDVDFEFRCQNSDCSITSCRKCQQHTHIPLTCDEAAKLMSKDAALEQRHTIEEAMTAALIRNCTRCKKPFIKDYGCNKMTCPSCGNLQCYVCSKAVTDYNHFHKNDGCPLHDNVEERHAEEVKKAEAAARAKVEAENPLVSKEDLDFQVSERVRKDEAAADARRRHVAAAGGGGHAGIANYAAIFGHDGLDNDRARAQREVAMMRQQQALQRNVEAQRNRMNLQRQNANLVANARAMQVAGPAGPVGGGLVEARAGLGARLARLHRQLAEAEWVRDHGAHQFDGAAGRGMHPHNVPALDGGIGPDDGAHVREIRPGAFEYRGRNQRPYAPDLFRPPGLDLQHRVGAFDGEIEELLAGRPGRRNPNNLLDELIPENPQQ